MDEPEYKLTWSGQKDSSALRSAVEYLKVFPLFGDSEARLIDHSEYMDLVKAGEILEPKSHWQIKEDRVGLISLTLYNQYTNTWEKINNAKTDFLAGWRACEKETKGGNIK